MIVGLYIKISSGDSQFSEVMERTHFSLVALSIFILLTVRCWCEEEAYNPLTETGSDRDLKRLDDIGYDSFLGLMGRRNAALTNRDTDHSLADLLGWRTSMTSLRGNRYAEKRGGGFTDHGRLRMERFV